MVQLQWIVWFLVVLLSFSSYVQNSDPLFSAAAAIVNVLFTAVIVYGNAFALFPFLYRKRRIVWYIVMVVLLILFVCVMRVLIRRYLQQIFYPGEADQSSLSQLYIVYLVSGTTTFLFSLVFRFAFDYFTVRRQQELLLQRTTEAELNLFKAQVQPHFLFNTLNNIYFFAQRESPQTASLLEKLSDIMRYFVDEAPKKKIPLSAELNFIRNYIDLEMMRMRHPLQLDIQVGENLTWINVPPMLVIPLIENTFKHGVNKRRNDNSLFFCIRERINSLHIEVQNRVFNTESGQKTGTGLQNLRARLKLIYGNEFELTTFEKESTFIAQLTIPLRNEV